MHSTYRHSGPPRECYVGRVGVVQLSRVSGALRVFRALRVAYITEGLVLDSVEKTALPRSRLAQKDHANVVGVLLSRHFIRWPRLQINSLTYIIKDYQYYVTNLIVDY